MLCAFEIEVCLWAFKCSGARRGPPNYKYTFLLFFIDTSGTNIWWNIQEPLPSFTGRQSELHLLVELLEKKKTVAICGFGGMGKTELARKFIQMESELKYNNSVIWISSESIAQIEDTFHSIASYLGLPTKGIDSEEKVSFEVILSSVYRRLSKDKCLIVFDNVEKNIRHFLPHLPPNDNKVHVLITSRYQDFDCHVEILHLTVWSKSDATTFIQSELGTLMPIKNEIESISSLLGHFPLALQQAIALIKRKNLLQPFSLSDFKTLYNEKQKYVLESKLPREHDYAESIFTTTLVTYENIKQDKLGRVAEQILTLITFLSPDDIPGMFLASMLSVSDDDLAEVLEMLKNYSVITCYIKDSRPLLTIHRLIKDFLSLEIKEDTKAEILRCCLSIMRNRADFPLQSIEIWNQAMQHNNLLSEFGPSILVTVTALHNLRC